MNVLVALLLLASAPADEGDARARAEAKLQSALRLDNVGDYDDAPGFKIGWHMLATMYTGLGRDADGADAYTRYIALLDGDEDSQTRFAAYCCRGRAYLRLKRCDLAEADFSQAMLSPVHADYSYFSRGIARRRLGDRAGAKADSDAAIRINPDIKQKFPGESTD